MLSVGEEGWKVLLVDKTSMRIISTCCRMYDVMEKGITVVENVNIERQPLSKLEAIYFLSPSEESVNALINDFDPEKKKKLMYQAVHLFFTTRVPDSLFLKIKRAKVHARIRTFKELNIDFLVPESQVYHFNAKDSLGGLFARGADTDDRYIAWLKSWFRCAALWAISLSSVTRALPSPRPSLPPLATPSKT